MSVNFAFPYAIGSTGLTETAAELDHITQLIEQVLFTSPGERVNQPTFGTDLRHLVFAERRDELVAAVEATVHGALQQWLGDLISVRAVDVKSEDATVTVAVSYVYLKTQEARLVRFLR